MARKRKTPRLSRMDHWLARAEGRARLAIAVPSPPPAPPRAHLPSSPLCSIGSKVGGNEGKVAMAAVQPSTQEKPSVVAAAPAVKPPPHPLHDGVPVRIGGHVVYAGGTRDLRPGDFSRFDLLVPCTEDIPLAFGGEYRVIGAQMADYHAPDIGAWERLLWQKILPAIGRGEKLLFFCVGGHGRTGTALASLIALMEPETKDPIASLRARYCERAVESAEQAELVFGLRDLPCPEEYQYLGRLSKGPGFSSYGDGVWEGWESWTGPAVTSGTKSSSSAAPRAETTPQGGLPPLSAAVYDDDDPGNCLGCDKPLMSHLDGDLCDECWADYQRARCLEG